MQLRETYTYGGKAGRVSARSALWANDTALTGFDQSWVYDDLGEVTSMSYPRCTQAGCTGAAATARTVTYGYGNGFLTSIPGYVSSIGYGANGTTAGRGMLLRSGVWVQVKPLAWATEVGSSGFDAGLTGAFNFAVGNGPWEGDFLSTVINVGISTVGFFGGPDNGPAWYGIQGGGSVGLPMGAGVTTTRYTSWYLLPFDCDNE